MSTHSNKAVQHTPNPLDFEREQFPVAHITIEVCDHPKNGATFALVAGSERHKNRNLLFSGNIEKGMGTQLRRLAHRIDELEPSK